MPSLFMICSGKNKLYSLIGELQNKLQRIITENGLALYNLKKLWKAESNPKFLQTETPLILSTTTDNNQEYCGFFNIRENDIYSRLFTGSKVAPHDNGSQVLKSV